MGISAKASEKEAAEKFVKFLFEEESQRASNDEGLAAVSYTHLDVYKRQDTDNFICLYRATCGAAPGFEKSQSGKYSEIKDFVQGEFPLAAQVPIPIKFMTEYFRYRHIKL